MLRWLFILAIVGRACTIRIPLIQFKSEVYREPLIDGPIRTTAVELEYVEQRVDNFDPTNDATWQMRYYRNDEFFVRGGPIFVYCGGEWTINPYSLQRGHMVDMARTLSGQMFYTEHRYYGLSHPTADASVENMRFLNIEQALADLAHFVTYIRERHPEFDDSNFVFVGGSYSATLVAWFRQKYPHLTAGAWASSSPVFVKPNNFEYKEIVGASIRSVGGEECFQRLARAFSQADQLFANRNFEQFSSTFRTCDEVNDDNPYDIQIMFYSLSELLAGLVQGHRSGDIEGFCETLLDPAYPDESDLDAFVRWYTRRVFGSNPSPGDCVDFTFDNDVEIHRNATWGSPATSSAMRQWFFQTCNEFGWFETSASRFQPFGSRFPAEKFHRWCSDVYGDEFTAEFLQANTERKNTIYGGFNPNVNNVYFTNGLIDPWRIMGIQNDVNEHSPADIIPDASHCNDLSSNSPDDSPRMREVRDRILQLVRLWTGLDE
ncbi:putative serine protease K12H4.7 [Bradysia coprophila]|uniref:putative serine protease K12H4.7 n=1 Tax=Bradysia coprophila TaxID=38358 RepID=UPI00187D90FE|nr:putative serine protease K12H4.7 [Bradysia coprophila]